MCSVVFLKKSCTVMPGTLHIQEKGCSLVNYSSIKKFLPYLFSDRFSLPNHFFLLISMLACLLHESISLSGSYTSVVV